MAQVVLGLTVEVVLVGKTKKNVTARVDTGATKSSIDTKLAAEIGFGAAIKTTTIKQAHGLSKRQVVRGLIQLNGRDITSEFTLADRAHMKYKLLIGQNILKDGNFLIDPNKEKTA